MGMGSTAVGLLVSTSMMTGNTVCRLQRVTANGVATTPGDSAETGLAGVLLPRFLNPGPRGTPDADWCSLGLPRSSQGGRARGPARGVSGEVLRACTPSMAQQGAQPNICSH